VIFAIWYTFGTLNFKIQEYKTKRGWEIKI